MKLDKNKVAIGLSGGVDSTAAAYLLKKKGFEVIGLTMKLFDDDTDLTIIDAQKAAKALGIAHHIIDLKDDFKINVIDSFINEYLRGKTPNPCVMCNKYIKYGKFIEKAQELGAYYIAMGHYIDLKYDRANCEYKILKHKINTKDQTYLMYSISQEKLKHLLYPLADVYSKKEVRELVKKLGLNIYDKKDSVGICFIKEKNYGQYIQKQLKGKVSLGKFVDINGNIIGEHKGIFNYTIGQRRGLGHRFNKPMYVINIDYDNNKIVLGDNRYTYAKGVIGEDINFISDKNLNDKLEVEAKICQWGYSIAAILFRYNKNKIKVEFKEMQRAPAIGQSIVLYKDSELLGGGKIVKVLK